MFIKHFNGGSMEDCSFDRILRLFPCQTVSKDTVNSDSKLNALTISHNHKIRDLRAETSKSDRISSESVHSTRRRPDVYHSRERFRVFACQREEMRP